MTSLSNEGINGESLTIILEIWRTGETPEDWRGLNVDPIFKLGKEEDLRNYRSVILTPINVNVLKQLLENIICEHLKL